MSDPCSLLLASCAVPLSVALLFLLFVLRLAQFGFLLYATCNVYGVHVYHIISILYYSKIIFFDLLPLLSFGARARSRTYRLSPHSRVLLTAFAQWQWQWAGRRPRRAPATARDGDRHTTTQRQPHGTTRPNPYPNPQNTVTVLVIAPPRDKTRHSCRAPAACRPLVATTPLLPLPASALRRDSYAHPHGHPHSHARTHNAHARRSASSALPVAASGRVWARRQNTLAAIARRPHQ